MKSNVAASHPTVHCRCANMRCNRSPLWDRAMVVSLEVATQALQHYMGYKNIMHTSWL